MHVPECVGMRNGNEQVHDVHLVFVMNIILLFHSQYLDGEYATPTQS